MKRAMNRRQFLQSAGAATAAAVAWQIVPRHVLGRGQVPPSEKVNIAAIGVGGQGPSDLQQLSATGTVNIVAVCDVDPRRTDAMVRKYSGTKPFSDYRKMLDQLGDGID